MHCYCQIFISSENTPTILMIVLVRVFFPFHCYTIQYFSTSSSVVVKQIKLYAIVLLLLIMLSLLMMTMMMMMRMTFLFIIFAKQKILGRSKLKELADDKINVTIKLKFVLGRVKNVVGKGEMLVTVIFSFSPQRLSFLGR